MWSIHNMILGPNGIYFTGVAASYRGEARGLWINASSRELSLVKFHLSEFRIWKGFSPPVTCFGWKPPLRIPSHKWPSSQRLDGTSSRRPSPLLAIETGRYSKPKIPVENRLCELCNMNVLCRRRVPHTTGVSVLQQWEGIDVWWNQPAYSAEQCTLSIHFQDHSFIVCCKFCFHTSCWVIH